MTGHQIAVLTVKENDIGVIDRLEIIPDITTAESDIIIARWPELTRLITPAWLDPNANDIP